MAEHSEDIVKVAMGTLIDMTTLSEVLKESGIESRVVGEELSNSLGSAIPGSVELWVNASDAPRASEIIARDDVQHIKLGQPERQKFPHPSSDPKPDRSQGSHHTPGSHRPNP